MEQKSLETLSRTKTAKSRLSKENKDVTVRLYYDERGLDRYFGLLELGELGGLWKNVAGRYEIDGKKVYAKAIYKDPEAYFTPEVMENLMLLHSKNLVMVVDGQIETVILRNLIYTEEYLRKVAPFIKAEYFEDTHQKIVFEEILSFVQEYNEPATKEVLCIQKIEKRTDINDTSFNEITKLISYLEDVPCEYNWLVDTTEKWCRDRAIYLALMESIALADGKDEKKDRDAIPGILSDALGVSFDTHIGHDYLLDYEARYETYHRKEDKIEFDLEYFNKITKGGLPNKTLNIALAGTGVGKSLFMCHLTALSSSWEGKTYYTSRLRWVLEEKLRI